MGCSFFDDTIPFFADSFYMYPVNTLISLPILLVVIIGLLWYLNYQSKVTVLVNQARTEQHQDPTKALQTVQKAIDIAPNNANVLRTRNEIYSNNEIYQNNWLLDTPIKDIVLSKNEEIVVASGDTVKLFNKNGTTKWTQMQAAKALCVDISSGSERVLLTNKAGMLKVLDMKTGEYITMREHKDWIRTAIFLPDGERILSGDRAGNIFLWNSRTDSLLQTYKGHSDEIWDLAYSPATEQFVSASWDETAKLWSLSTGLATDLPIEGRGLAADISPDGTQIAIGDRAGTIYLYDTLGQIQYKVPAHSKRINALQYAHNGLMLLSASDDKTVRLCDTAGHPLKIYKGHQDYVQDIAFTKSDRAFYSASEDGTIKKWQVESKVSRFFGPHENEVSALAISEDGTLMVSGSGSGQQDMFNNISDLGFNFDALSMQPKPQNAFIWHLEEDNRAPDTLSGHEGGITSVAISQKAGLILTGSDDSTARFWDLEGNPLSEMVTHQAGVHAVDISKDGKWFATGGYDNLVVLGKTATLLADTIHLWQSEEVEVMAFSPTEDNILLGLSGREALLLDFEGQTIASFKNDVAGVTAVAFSPDGTQVLVGHAGNEAILYSVEGDSLKTFVLVGENKTGGKGVNDMAFSADGELVALVGEGGMVRVFEVESGEVVLEWGDLFGEGVAALGAFGDGIFVGGGDGVVREYSRFAIASLFDNKNSRIKEMTSRADDVGR